MRCPPPIFGATLGVVLAVACGRIGFDATTRDGRADDAVADDAPRTDTGGLGCPPTYDVVAGLAHRYRFLGTIDYDAGTLLCQADGFAPAVIDDAAEATALTAVTGFGSAWAGVRGLAGGTWETALGAPAAYLPWGPNEPIVTGVGACVEVYPTDLSFHAEPTCTYQWFMFCECTP